MKEGESLIMRGKEILQEVMKLGFTTSVAQVSRSTVAALRLLDFIEKCTIIIMITLIFFYY